MDRGTERLMRFVLAIGGAARLGGGCPCLAAPPRARPRRGVRVRRGLRRDRGRRVRNGHGDDRGATWAAGRYGGALSFDGTNDYVGLPRARHVLQHGFTLEAWVQKSDDQERRRHPRQLDRQTARCSGSTTSRPATTLTLGRQPLRRTSTPARNPTSASGSTSPRRTTARPPAIYIDGTEVASRAVSGSVGSSNTWRIGAYGSVPGGFFDGLIDELRVYNRALSAAEIQADRDQPLGLVEPERADGARGTSTVTGSTTDLRVARLDCLDRRPGVAGYNVYCDGDVSVGTTTATSFTVTGLSCSTSYQLDVEAFDASGNSVAARRGDADRRRRCAPRQGLVAAYAFDEGSGAIGRRRLRERPAPARSPARRGRPGATAARSRSTASTTHVDARRTRHLLQHGASRSRPGCRRHGAKKDVGIVGSWAGQRPDALGRPHRGPLLPHARQQPLELPRLRASAPIAGQWQHVAATFDGATARFYVDGTQVADTRRPGSRRQLEHVADRRLRRHAPAASSTD